MAVSFEVYVWVRTRVFSVKIPLWQIYCWQGGLTGEIQTEVTL